MKPLLIAFLAVIILFAVTASMAQTQSVAEIGKSPPAFVTDKVMITADLLKPAILIESRDGRAAILRPDSLFAVSYEKPALPSESNYRKRWRNGRHRMSLATSTARRLHRQSTVELQRRT